MHNIKTGGDRNRTTIILYLVLTAAIVHVVYRYNSRVYVRVLLTSVYRACARRRPMPTRTTGLLCACYDNIMVVSQTDRLQTSGSGRVAIGWTTNVGNTDEFDRICWVTRIAEIISNQIFVIAFSCLRTEESLKIIGDVIGTQKG